MTKKTKGGARQGAGRKKSEKARTNVQLRMNVEDIGVIRTHAEFLNVRTNKYIEELIKNQEWLFFSHKLAAVRRTKSKEEQRKIIEEIKSQLITDEKD